MRLFKLKLGIFLTTALLVMSGFSEQMAFSLEEDINAFLGKPKFDITHLFQDERFPNVVVALDGTVIATWGNETVRARRSEDGGENWGEALVIAPGFHGGGTTVDESSGDILAFVEEGHPPAPGHVFRSPDQGKTWQEQTNTTIHPDSRGHHPSLHMAEHGISLKHGKHEGRLIRPARYYAGSNDRSNWPEQYNTAIYSDDGGHTWHTSEPFPENGTGEGAIVELADGTLYYNSRVHWERRPQNTRRRSAWSYDGGQTWEDWQIAETLPDGRQDRSYGCMGGLTRLPVNNHNILLFSNLDTPNPKRERVTVWASFDGGYTWPVKRLVHDGPSRYSSLTAGRADTPSEGWIYLHFEGGGEGSYIARFNLAWVLEGEATGDGKIPALRPSHRSQP